jgi:hypothetical protein
MHIFCVNFQKLREFNKIIMATRQAILELQKIVSHFFNIHSIHWVGIK